MSVLKFVNKEASVPESVCKLSYTRHKRDKTVENGVVKSSSSFEEFNFNDEFKKNDISVLAISNIIALGLENQLTFGQLRGSSLSAADNLDKQLNLIENETIS